MLTSGCNREMFHLPRDASVRRHVGRRLVSQPIAEFVLDIADHRPVTVAAADVEQDEGVERVAMRVVWMRASTML
jgi:hypothetical protein